MPFIPENNDESPLKRPAQVLALAALASLSFCRDPQPEKPAPVAHASQHVQTETRRIVTNTHSEPEAEPADTASQNEALPDSEPEEEKEPVIEPATDLMVPYRALSVLSECITENNENVVCSNRSGVADSSLICYSLNDSNRPPLTIQHSTLEGDLPTKDEFWDIVMKGEYPEWNEVDTSRFIMAPGVWNWDELENTDKTQIEDISMPYNDVAPGLEDLCDRATTWFDKDPGQWCTGETCERSARTNADWIANLNEDLDNLAPFEESLLEQGWAPSETIDSFTLGFQLNDDTSIEIHLSGSKSLFVDIKTSVESDFVVEMHEAETPNDLMQIIGNVE